MRTAQWFEAIHQELWTGAKDTNRGDSRIMSGTTPKAVTPAAAAAQAAPAESPGDPWSTGRRCHRERRPQVTDTWAPLGTTPASTSLDRPGPQCAAPLDTRRHSAPFGADSWPSGQSIRIRRSYRAGRIGREAPHAGGGLPGQGESAEQPHREEIPVDPDRALVGGARRWR